MVYSHLAPYYDTIMWHVEYTEWYNLINKIINKYITGKEISIFEIGGGTGTLGSILHSSNISYFGSDLSFHMASESLKKELPFICADARHLPIKIQFDMVIFLYDGINYLKTLKEYQMVFSSVFPLLKSDGFFLFDITTETNSKRYFLDYFSCDEFEKTTILRHSYYNEYKKLQFNDFTIFSPDINNSDLYVKECENHVQKIFSPNQIESVIPKKKYHTVGIWDDFSMLRYTKKSERIHFLLQKIPS